MTGEEKLEQILLVTGDVGLEATDGVELIWILLVIEETDWVVIVSVLLVTGDVG